MDLDWARGRLAAGVESIAALVKNVDSEQARWKPEPTKWSILEVMCHLRDEEREDFFQRVKYTLTRPGESWPVIDPEGWVVSREYNQQDLEKVTADFLSARAASLDWLGTLSSPDWDLTYQHQALGELSAGMIMAAWVGHDYLHVRQLARLHWQYTQGKLEPYSLRYAGEW